MSPARYAWVLLLSFFVADGAAATDVAQPRIVDPLQRPARITPLSGHANLLGVALAGSRLVAVGERGVALFSDDQGQSWTQAAVPVSVTLTVVRFGDPRHGWAAGHDGVLLRSEDAGASWRKVLDGRDVVVLYQQWAAQLADEYGEDDPRVLQAQRQAEQLAADGPDKPWLDLNVDGRGQLWLVGAYGLMLHSEEGQRWSVASDRLDNPGGMHLYAIRSNGQEMVIAGEQGLLLRSGDGGQSFTPLTSPYRGSFFVLELVDGEIVVGGLRGNLFRSRDDGQHFQQVPMPVPVSLTASLHVPGAVLLADQAGAVFRLQAGRLQPLEDSAGPGAAALIATSSGELIGVGRYGPRHVRLP